MRILLCRPGCNFSVSDVSRGYERALIVAGHDVRAFDLSHRLTYHARAIGEAWKDNIRALSQQATEMIVVEAMKHAADLVIIVSALVFHPLGLVLLRRAGFPTAVLMTESPYDDAEQLEWASAYPEAHIFTHERVSAERYGWTYLPHAYDPSIHYPREVEQTCDVLMLGTGWPERVALLEQIDWTGIRLRLLGLWATLTEASPLWSFYEPGCIDNEDAPALYASARICLNLHRYHPDAVSPNPRAYELAACGSFTISDVRADAVALFGVSQPTFTTPAQFETLVRHYLAHPGWRDEMRRQAMGWVAGKTFEARAAALLTAIQQPAAVAAV